MNDRKMVKTEIGKRELDNLRELLLHPDRDRLTPWEVVEIAADDLEEARAELVRVRQEADELRQRGYGYSQATVDDLIAAVSHERVRADTLEAECERLGQYWSLAEGDAILQRAEVGRLRGVLQQVQAAIEPWLKFIEAAGDGPWEIEGVNEWPGRDAVRRLASIVSVSGSANPTLNSQETFQGSVLRANPKQED